MSKLFAIKVAVKFRTRLKKSKISSFVAPIFRGGDRYPNFFHTHFQIALMFKHVAGFGVPFSDLRGIADEKKKIEDR